VSTSHAVADHPRSHHPILQSPDGNIRAFCFPNFDHSPHPYLALVIAQPDKRSFLSRQGATRWLQGHLM